MRFVLVGPTIEENLSLAYLAAALRSAGHEARTASFVRDDEHETVARRIVALAPDAVGLSMTFQSRGRGFLALAASLRSAGFAGPLVAGGHWASVAAEPILRDHPTIDAILRGEAEDSLVQLADALRDGRPWDGIPGIVFRRGDRTVLGPRPAKRIDLDALPFPARDEMPHRHLDVPAAPLVASRGCRAGCTFCSIRTFGRLSDGPARRARSARSVAEEMAELHRSSGARAFVFHDDDFFSGEPATDLAWAEELRGALAALGLPRVALIVKARPDDVDPRVVDALAALGLVRVFLGIETDAPAGLRALGRTLEPGANRRALAALRDRGIFVCSNLLLWEPDTTLDDLHANLDLLAAFPGQIFNLARTELYEGAPLTRTTARRGRLLGDYLGRDYVVADPRAELAWRVFRVAMGERCYPLHGVVNAAMGLGYDAHLLRHFHPTERAARLADEALALVRRTAESTRDRLEQVVEYAAVAPLGPHPEVLQFTLDLARAVRGEDTALLAALRSAQQTLERCARGTPEPAGVRDEPAAPRSRGRGALLAAAAGLLACAKGGGTTVGRADGDAAPIPRDLPSAVDATEPAAPDTAGDAVVTADDAAAPEEVAATPGADSAAVTFRLSPQAERWAGCRGAERVGAFELGTLLEPGAPAATFERFEVTDGTVEDLYVAPDGSRAHAVLRVGERQGPQRVTAVYRLAEEGAGTIQRSEALYQYGKDAEHGTAVATAGADPQPLPECYQICDMAAPPPDTVLAQDGQVLFTHSPYDGVSGFAATFNFTVGLRANVRGERVGNPTVACTAGSASLSESSGGGYHRPPSPGETPAPELRDTYSVYYDPRPTDGSGRLEAGHHSCTVTYRIKQGDEEKEVRGAVHLRIDADGSVQIGVPAAPENTPVEPIPDGPSEATPAEPASDAARAPYPELPLSLRYAVGVRCLADYGNAVLLGAECPSGVPDESRTYLWSASAGRIEAVDGGARAVWRLPDEGGPAVALCAVQSVPFDLQLGSYRRG
jgi:anaerobic magnesium-protoporphyrin IX monomethyl ester cyclase